MAGNTLIIDDGEQTLSNKTLTSPVINTAICEVWLM